MPRYQRPVRSGWLAVGNSPGFLPLCFMWDSWRLVMEALGCRQLALLRKASCSQAVALQWDPRASEGSVDLVVSAVSFVITHGGKHTTLM